MFGQVFAHRTIRKYVIYFGMLFSEVFLTRDDADGRVQTMKVPLNFGPKEKFLARAEGNPDFNREIAIQLPRMAFEITGYQYDPDRKLTSSGRNTYRDANNPNNLLNQSNPVPYNIQFDLHIMVKNAEDGTRIIEQILPYFTPDFTSTLNLNQDLNMKYDIPLILNNVSHSDSYEGSFENRRAIIWTLTFTMKGYIFGPTKSSSIIKQAEINIRIPDGPISDAGTNIDPSVIITVTPGLTANGEPTSNSTLTIDKELINSSDNYGFIHDFFENQ